MILINYISFFKLELSWVKLPLALRYPVQIQPR